MALTQKAHEDVALPRIIHQTVQIPDSTRIVIVGDIHGCFDELQELLQKVNYDNSRDKLIFVGDLVNKGPKSAEVVRFAREHGVLSVRGNHDDAALGNYYAWKRHECEPSSPKYDYVRQLSDEDVAFLEQLPFTLTLQNQRAIVVHAGLVPGVPLEQQMPIDMYKMRWVTRLVTREGETPHPWAAQESKPTDASNVEVKAWATQWPGPLHVFFGHDAIPGIQQEPFATGLDTGCCYGRQLSACVLPTREIVSVQAHAAHAPMAPAPLQLDLHLETMS